VTQVLRLCHRVAHPLGNDMFALAFVAASLNLVETDSTS
jgi:hypothetical protein